VLGARWGHTGRLDAEHSPNFPAVRGWRAACSCGWTGTRRYPRQADRPPRDIVLHAAGLEWHRHLATADLLAKLDEILAEADAIHPLHRIRDEDVERRMGETVRLLREVATWQQIADHIGVSRQGAHDRFHHYLQTPATTPDGPPSKSTED